MVIQPISTINSFPQRANWVFISNFTCKLNFFSDVEVKACFIILQNWLVRVVHKCILTKLASSALGNCWGATDILYISMGCAFQMFPTWKIGYVLTVNVVLPAIQKMYLSIRWRRCYGDNCKSLTYKKRWEGNCHKGRENINYASNWKYSEKETSYPQLLSEYICK